MSSKNFKINGPIKIFKKTMAFKISANTIIHKMMNFSLAKTVRDYSLYRILLWRLRISIMINQEMMQYLILLHMMSDILWFIQYSFPHSLSCQKKENQKLILKIIRLQIVRNWSLASISQKLEIQKEEILANFSTIISRAKNEKLRA